MFDSHEDDRGDACRRRRGLTLTLAGTVIVAASGVAAWVEVLDKPLSGFRMADLIDGYGDRLDSVPPAWLGAAWYLIPMTAGACWMLAFMRKPPSVGRFHTLAGAAIAAASATFLAGAWGQPGPLVALAGGLLIMVGGLAGAGRRRKPDHDTPTKAVVETPEVLPSPSPPTPSGNTAARTAT